MYAKNDCCRSKPRFIKRPAHLRPVSAYVIADCFGKDCLQTSQSIDAGKVIDRATFEMPNQYPAGIEYVLVNGKISVDKGQRTAALAGRVLRGPGYKR